MSIEDELCAEIKRHTLLAKTNYRVAYCLSAIAVLASIIAGLSVAAQWFSTTKLAILSALPGAVLVVSDRFKFEERSNWHYRKVYALTGLLRQLRFEGKSEAEVSAQWRQLNDQIELLWPGFGRGPDARQP